MERTGKVVSTTRRPLTTYTYTATKWDASPEEHKSLVMAFLTVAKDTFIHQGSKVQYSGKNLRILPDGDIVNDPEVVDRSGLIFVLFLQLNYCQLKLN